MALSKSRVASAAPGRIVPGQGVPLEDALVGLETRRMLASRAVSVGHLHPPYERADDLLYHLVLDGEDLGLAAVKTVTPDLMAARRIDELHRDADAIAHAAYAPLDDEANVQFARHAGDVYVGAAVLEGRRPRTDFEQPPAGKLGDDVLADSVAEYLLLYIAAEVAERQHADCHADGSRSPAPARGRLECSRRGGLCGAASPAPGVGPARRGRTPLHEQPRRLRQLQSRGRGPR